MCARCHSRRGLVHEDHVHGQPVSDDYRVALLDDDLYYPDGQIKGEVYEYGSFMQSRMFAEGVTCSDCHDPHRPELARVGRQPVPAVPREQTYLRREDTTFTAEGSAGARCVNCHMPAATYMVVDPRRDHSLRVPRPDLSVKLGVPNACNGCHQDRSAAWAARTVEEWYGHTPSGHQQFAEALAAGSERSAGRAAAARRRWSPIAASRPSRGRARSRAWRIRPRRRRSRSCATRSAMPDALVRRAAVRALADAEPQLRASLLAPLLDDAVRTVRIEAAAAMADVPVESLPPAERDALGQATAEFVAAQELNGDRPEAHLALAMLRAEQQRFDAAEAELTRALSIDPAFVPAAVNLADLYRATGRDAAAEPILREALVHAPRESRAPARARPRPGARKARRRIASSGWERRRAAAPTIRAMATSTRWRSTATAARERRAEALEALLVRHPTDRDSLSALVSFCREAGDARGARRYVERLAALDAH